jgi:hypothetical protein
MSILDEFRTQVGQYGFQKPSWFEFRLVQPPTTGEELPPRGETFRGGVVLHPDPFQDLMSLGLVCTSMSLPGRGFATADQSIYGFERKVPYFNTYNPLQCTFVTPIDKLGFNIGHRYFQKWQDRISDTRTIGSKSGGGFGNYSLVPGAFDMSFPADYYAEAEIWQFSHLEDFTKSGVRFKNEPPSKEFYRQVSLRHRFFELYPVSVEATGLNWGENDSFTQLTVTFNYSYWVDVGPSEEKNDNFFAFGIDLDKNKDPNNYSGNASLAEIQAGGRWDYDPNGGWASRAPIWEPPASASRSKMDIFLGVVKQAAYNTAIFNGWIR